MQRNLIDCDPTPQALNVSTRARIEGVSVLAVEEIVTFENIATSPLRLPLADRGNLLRSSVQVYVSGVSGKAMPTWYTFTVRFALDCELVRESYLIVIQLRKH